jgi:membrane protease YdiL (CAAX protease family)
MTFTTPNRSDAVGAQANTPSTLRPKALLPFSLAALGIGVPLLALSTVIKPGAPFLIATILFGLALPALFLTHREGGGAAVRTLLRDCVRLPSPWWWLPLAAFALPVATWTTGVTIGGAKPLDSSLVSFYVTDLIINAVVINIWEEMAWTGFFQRRAADRWGVVGGALVTSLFFTGIHIPLALDGVDGLSEAVTNLLVLAGVATGVRLLIARVDVWSGRSLLTIGILHASFNASESLLDPDYFWVRIVVTIAIGISVIALGKSKHPTAWTARGGSRT